MTGLHKKNIEQKLQLQAGVLLPENLSINSCILFILSLQTIEYWRLVVAFHSTCGRETSLVSKLRISKYLLVLCSSVGLLEVSRTNSVPQLPCILPFVLYVAYYIHTVIASCSLQSLKISFLFSVYRCHGQATWCNFCGHWLTSNVCVECTKDESKPKAINIFDLYIGLIPEWLMK